MGHEFIGIVEEAGREVSAVATGDFVIGPFAYSDNTCPICRDGFHTACLHGGFFSAAQAELLRGPQADGTLVVAPATEDEEMLKSLLTLSDVFLTGHHAAHMGRVGPGRA